MREPDRQRAFDRGQQRQKVAAKVLAEMKALERQIAATDAEIDGLVYELYGLTYEDIKIIDSNKWKE